VADDGTITGWVIEAPRAFAGQTVLTLALPADTPHARISGRYFLARCGAQTAAERAEQWEIYLRRPLFGVWREPLRDPPTGDRAERHDRWLVAVPPGDDPGFAWLRRLAPGAPLNLLGPLGNGFFLAPGTRNLLVVADVDRLAPLTALFDAALDRGGHVTLAVRQGAVDATLQTQLPVAVEVQTLPTGDGWLAALAAPLRWADQLCLALPASTYVALAEAIRRQRLRLESGFGFALVDADLACGYGACLACVTPLGNGGLTRACVHGPVIDLLELVAA
jgi:dihydroorotate dehydrogenase electron transfer subunit